VPGLIRRADERQYARDCADRQAQAYANPSNPDRASRHLFAPALAGLSRSSVAQRGARRNFLREAAHRFLVRAFTGWPSGGTRHAHARVRILRLRRARGKFS
jgi:hypothetical protein